MYKGKSVSVVMATYKEKDSVRSVIDEFFKTDFVDEVIVVNNNAEEGTNEEIAKTKARVLHESRQGYGYAIETGLKAAVSDYIVIAEPDGTYTAEDLKRFLVFAEDFKVVLGSRSIIRVKNKDWGFFRRHANIAQGMMISLLFHTNTITDVGCLYRLFHKDAIKQIAPLWNTQRLFATDILVWVVKENIPFAEIPVSFQERVGPSTMLGGGLKLFRYGLDGLIFIFQKWIPWAFSAVLKRK